MAASGAWYRLWAHGDRVRITQNFRIPIVNADVFVNGRLNRLGQSIYRCPSANQKLQTHPSTLRRLKAGVEQGLETMHQQRSQTKTSMPQNVRSWAGAVGLKRENPWLWGTWIVSRGTPVDRTQENPGLVTRRKQARKPRTNPEPNRRPCGARNERAGEPVDDCVIRRGCSGPNSPFNITNYMFPNRGQRCSERNLTMTRPSRNYPFRRKRAGDFNAKEQATLRLVSGEKSRSAKTETKTLRLQDSNTRWPGRLILSFKLALEIGLVRCRTVEHCCQVATKSRVDNG